MRVSKNRKNNQKICVNCEVFLTEENTNDYDLRSGKYICLSCLKERNQARYQSKREKIRSNQKIYEANIKIEVMKAYGNKCKCCGEEKIEFLTIDHIDDNGATERKNSNQGTGGKFYRWLKKNNFPKDNYQILCFNCNCAKGFYGYCPHNKITT